MEKKLSSICLLLAFVQFTCFGQITEKISEKVTLSINSNIETYFIAEKLAVEHIGNYVFSDSSISFTHQPLVYYSLKEFLPWKNKPIILRIAAILKQMHEIQHDNAQQLEYLLYKNQFPQTGFRWPVPDNLGMFDEKLYPGDKTLGLELADSLASFYNQAEIGNFLKRNAAFYKGALAEARKHINPAIIPAMEKWYGEKFAGYELYLMPGMPISPGDDNYRAFGPTLITPGGKVSVMVFSSSIQLPLLPALKDYQHFGFDNGQVTKFLTVHEIGHSFVNPHLKTWNPDILHDTALFTAALAKAEQPYYIDRWETCIIEHLVRLGEIRISRSIGDTTEERRLRKMHMQEFRFALLPYLEKVIASYEDNRSKYPDFKSFLPEIFKALHKLTPADVDRMLRSPGSPLPVGTLPAG